MLTRSGHQYDGKYRMYFGSRLTTARDAVLRNWVGHSERQHTMTASGLFVLKIKYVDWHHRRGEMCPGLGVLLVVGKLAALWARQ